MTGLLSLLVTGCAGGQAQGDAPPADGGAGGAISDASVEASLDITSTGGSGGASEDGADSHRPDAASDVVVSDAAPTAPSPKVLTFNIRYANMGDGPDAWPLRRDQVYRLLMKEDPDLIGFQEALVGQVQDLEAALPQYRRVGVGRDDGRTAGEFSPIFYRALRFDLTASGTFWFSDTPEIPGSIGWGNTVTRICTWARLTDRATGRALYQFNVHLDNVSAPSREKSVQLLMKRVQERPVRDDPFIVTGDLNAGESDLAIQYLKGAAPIGAVANPIPLADSFRQIHPDATDVKTYHAFQGGTAGQKLDFIFLGPGQRALTAEILRAQENGRYPSDHYPVSAVIAWGSLYP